MGNTTLLTSSSIYAKRHINVCSGGDLCSPFLSNFSETPCVKVGFDVKGFPSRTIFPEVGDSIFFCLPRPYLNLRGTVLSHTKSKASEYEQLILASTPGKSLRRFRKDNNHLMHTKLLQMTNESLSGQRPSTLYLYVCIYSLFYLEYLKTFEWFLFSLKYKASVKFSK